MQIQNSCPCLLVSKKSFNSKSINKKPDIFLFDEITSSLDSTTKKQIISTITDLSANSDNNAIIWATHDVSEALEMCNKVILLEEEDYLQLLKVTIRSLVKNIFQNFYRKASAFLKKDFINQASYRLSFILNIFSIFLAVYIFLFFQNYLKVLTLI